METSCIEGVAIIPGLGQDVFDKIRKLIELFGVQSEGTMVTQRLLRL